MVRGQWASLARMPGLHPYTFLKDILGFLMTTESQDLIRRKDLWIYGFTLGFTLFYGHSKESVKLDIFTHVVYSTSLYN